MIRYSKFLRYNITRSLLLLAGIVLLLVPLDSRAVEGASLTLAPASGSYLVGSTFDVTVLVNTGGNLVNTVDVQLRFPPDKLQVTRPLSGQSFIETWFQQPTFSNSQGTVQLVGGIAGGISTSNGLVITITFRVISPGEAVVEILKSSKILAHDGKGTDLLTSRGLATYQLLVRPPEGPEVLSSTHPDSSRWYQNDAPIFSWARPEGATGFSYLFNENPEDTPQPVVRTTNLVQAFGDVPDGIWYFHLRAEKSGEWGGTTHFVTKIDATSPQAFTPRIEYAPQLGAPPLIFFDTKDIRSGIDHYTVKVIRTDEASGAAEDITPFFIETESPYKVPVSFPGKYTVVVRAFDRAGNTQDARVDITTPTVALLSDQGVRFRDTFIPIRFIYLFFGLLLIVLFLWGLYLLRNIRRIRYGMRKDIAVLSREMQQEYRELGERFSREWEGRRRGGETRDAYTSPPGEGDVPEPPPPA